MSMLEDIKALLKELWEFIKKITLKIFNFIKNIVNWFKEPSRLDKLKDENVIAVAIKEKLVSGDYQVVNCLFNKESEKLVDVKEDAVVYTAENLDAEARKQFGDKDMLVIQ